MFVATSLDGYRHVYNLRNPSAVTITYNGAYRLVMEKRGGRGVLLGSYHAAEAAHQAFEGLLEALESGAGFHSVHSEI